MTDFCGYQITRHLEHSLFRKYCSKISSVCDAATKDGYKLRIFGIAFTDRQPRDPKSNCYIKSSTIKIVRKRMNETILGEISGCSMKDLMVKLANKSINAAIANK